MENTLRFAHTYLIMPSRAGKDADHKGGGRATRSPMALAYHACIAYNMCMQYTVRKVSTTLDAVLRRWAREQGKSINEVATEAMARGAGLSGHPVRQRDLNDIAGTWREDRTFARTRAAHEAIDAELWR